MTVKDLPQEDADSIDGNEAPPDYLVPTPRRFDAASSEQQMRELREVLRFCYLRECHECCTKSHPKPHPKHTSHTQINVYIERHLHPSVA